MNSSKIIGMGFHVPDNIITNEELSQKIDTSDEWIQTRSGIRERRWATEEISTFDLAHQASLNAISNAGINPQDIDMIVVGILSCGARTFLSQFHIQRIKSNYPINSLFNDI